MISEDKREILEKSIFGNLSDDELVLFNRYCDDEEFRQEMLLWQEMQPVFEHHGRARMKNRLEAKEKSLAYKQSNKTRIFSILIAVAASAIILVGIFFALSSERSSETLFAAYFTPAENTSFLITRGTGELSLEAQAYGAYGGGQYQLANQLFDQLEKSDTISFYKAIGHLAMRNFSDARNILTDLSFESESYLQQSKEWYLALAHLADGDVMTSLRVLDAIAKNDVHYNKMEARELQSKLK